MARALVAREDALGAGLGRNTSPDDFAGPGTGESRIARVVQRAAGAASWVTPQQAGAAFPGARGAAAPTRATIEKLANATGTDA